jgi:hypothetical protein
METVKIKNRESLVRDVTTRAVINTNRTEYENYLARKKRGEDMRSRIDQNCKDIDCIKNDLQEVKSMLMLLIKQESK